MSAVVYALGALMLAAAVYFALRRPASVVGEEDDGQDFNCALFLLESRCNIFITGGAGTGKSYLLSRLKKHYGDRLTLTSTTGISALNIAGQTIHSWSGIGIANTLIKATVERIRRNPQLFGQIITCEMLAIDEISMLDNFTLDYINEVLKEVRESPLPFGGIQVILLGDFFQLPPVSLDQPLRDFCFLSRSWQELNLQTLLLTKVRRQKDLAFAQTLNNIRIGKTGIDDLRLFYKLNNKKTPDCKVLRIFGTNREADEHNALCFAAIDKEVMTFSAVDKLYKYDTVGNKKTSEISPALKMSKTDKADYMQFDEDCKAPAVLKLKKSCRVMLLKNLDFKLGLVNGSTGEVIGETENHILIKFDNGIKKAIGREIFEFIKDGQVKISREQFPLRLAYGITIHKSQGMTFDTLAVHFNKIFAPGQAYVALSRTRTADGLYLSGFDHNLIITSPKVVDFYHYLESGDTKWKPQIVYCQQDDEILTIIETALRNRQNLHLIYKKEDGSESERDITPLRLNEKVDHNGEIHFVSLQATCHKTNSLRTFRLERIVHVELLSPTE